MGIVPLFQQIVHWPTGQFIGYEATIRGEDEQGHNMQLLSYFIMLQLRGGWSS